MPTPTIRTAKKADIPQLAEVYQDAVTSLGPAHYNEEQITIWANWPRDNAAEFERRMSTGVVLVAELDSKLVAFGQWVPPDHLDFLYTRGEFARQGLAKALHEALETIARKQRAPLLRTEASRVSRPVFSKFGYQVTGIEEVSRSGVSFERFIMNKLLAVGPPATSKEQRVLIAHAPSLPESPVVHAGERIAFDRADENNPGWFCGRDARGVQGYFPLMWFRVEPDRQSTVAQRDYMGHELTVSPGDRVWIIETVGAWHHVINPTGTIGWIPTACLN